MVTLTVHNNGGNCKPLLEASSKGWYNHGASRRPPEKYPVVPKGCCIISENEEERNGIETRMLKEPQPDGKVEKDTLGYVEPKGRNEITTLGCVGGQDRLRVGPLVVKKDRGSGGDGGKLW